MGFVLVSVSFIIFGSCVLFWMFFISNLLAFERVECIINIIPEKCSVYRNNYLVKICYCDRPRYNYGSSFTVIQKNDYKS